MVCVPLLHLAYFTKSLYFERSRSAHSGHLHVARHRSLAPPVGMVRPHSRVHHTPTDLVQMVLEQVRMPGALPPFPSQENAVQHQHDATKSDSACTRPHGAF